jgi:hypothetical protein
MHPTRFDALTRALSQTRTRRGALRALGGVAARSGAVPGGHANAAKAGSTKDLADMCRLAGGIPAPRLDGGLNCVLDNGWEIHCDASGQCRSHCWPQYGCSCEHADVCHRTSLPFPFPRNPVTMPDGAGVLLSPSKAKDSPPATGGSTNSRRKPRKRRKRSRRPG